MRQQLTIEASRIRRRSAGFTVIELMIVVAIGAVLLAIGAPSLAGFLRESRLSTAMSDLTSDMQAARGDAVKRNAWVLVCARAAATDTCANGTNWSNGWLACFDVNNDGNCDAGTATDPNPFRVRRALDSITLTGPATAMRFNPGGSQGGTGAATVTFTMTGTWADSSTRTGTVAPTGFIKSVKSY